MSQIALLSGANPRSCKHGPVVRLLRGTWRLDVQGMVDSSLLLHIRAREAVRDPILLGMKNIIKCEEVEQVQLHFGIRGTEDYITVIAEKVA